VDRALYSYFVPPPPGTIVRIHGGRKTNVAVI
jgi:hypothetical protein